MCTGSSLAAVITWGPAQDTSAPSDVSLNGTLNEAVNMVAGPDMMPGSTTVNGVLFTNDDTKLPLTYSAGMGVSTGDASYDALLNYLDYGDDGAGSYSIQVGSGLSVGVDYEIQLWYADNRSFAGSFSMIYGDGNGNTVTLGAFGNGQFAIGTFVADGSTQTIDLTAGSPPGTCHMNGYQVRGPFCDAVGTTVELDDPMQVSESDVDGSAVQFTVELFNTPPIQAGDVITVTVESADPNTGGPNVDLTINDSGSAVDLTFTDTTWNIPQTITIKAIDDDIIDDSYAEMHLITFSLKSANGDSNYGGLDGNDPDGGCISPVGVRVLDDETPAFAVSKTSVSVSEDGTVDSYTIALETDPTDTVTVDIIADCQATVTASLTFSAGDTGPKTVTVGAVDDSVVELPIHATTISHVVTTTDPGYMDATIPDVDVSIDDNDARVWSFGDDVLLSMPNYSFEDPVVGDGGIYDVNDLTPAPGFTQWSPRGVSIVDLTDPSWAAMYDAGHQAAPLGNQVLLLEPPAGEGRYFEDVYIQQRYVPCEYKIEEGPVSYIFEAEIGSPREPDTVGWKDNPDAWAMVWITAFPPDGGALVRIAEVYVTDQLVAGQWVDIDEVCVEIPADSPYIDGEILVTLVGNYVHSDNWRVSVANHPCPGCYLDITAEEGDLDDDCDVDLKDFAIMAASWLRCNTYPECVTSW